MSKKITLFTAAVFVALFAGSVWLALWASPDRRGDSYGAQQAEQAGE